MAGTLRYFDILSSFKIKKRENCYISAVFKFS